MKVTFEFADNFVPCAVWCNYVVWDGAQQIMGVRSADQGELQQLTKDKEAVLKVKVGENR